MPAFRLQLNRLSPTGSALHRACLTVPLAIAVAGYSIRRALTTTLGAVPINIPRRHTRRLILAGGLVLIALAKAPFLYDVSGDYRNWVQGWFAYIKAQGVFHAYGTAFSNYTPLYTYMLGVAALLTPDNVAPLVPIKLITFAGEALASVAAYRLVGLRYGCESLLPLLAALLLPLLPTVLLNGASWGQCDIWYSAFFLWAVYYFAVERPGTAMLYISLALAFKPQGLMIAPLVTTLFIRGQIAWPYVLVVPIVYLGLAVPCVWEGRPLLNVLSVYANQFATYSSLAMNSANLYWLVPNEYYSVLIPIGLPLGFALALAYALRTASKLPHGDVASLLFAGALGVALLFYTMPKMHERYLFGAEVMLFVLTFVRPCLLPLALQFQLTSFISYMGFLGTYHLPVSFESSMYWAVALNGIGIAVMGYLWYTIPDAPAATVAHGALRNTG